MSTRQVSTKADPLIENRDQLVEPMQRGEKPREAWRIGTEHEKFVYRTADHRAPSYDEPGGIRDATSQGCGVRSGSVKNSRGGTRDLSPPLTACADRARA